MQGKQIKFNLDVKQYDMVQEFSALVKMNRNKVAKHMLFVGIQNYMRAAEQEKLRRIQAEEAAQNVGQSVGVTEGSSEQTQVSEVTDPSPSEGQTADGTSPA